MKVPARVTLNAGSMTTKPMSVVHSDMEVARAIKITTQQNTPVATIVASLESIKV